MLDARRVSRPPLFTADRRCRLPTSSLKTPGPALSSPEGTAEPYVARTRCRILPNQERGNERKCQGLTPWPYSLGTLRVFRSIVW